MDRFPAPISVPPLLPWWQRTCDILIVVAFGVFLLPVILVVSLLVLAFMGRPILFRQKRPGLLERGFEMMKFRTMKHTAYSSSSASPDAARITPLGAFLRRSSLDELPELWNILRGEMSLVGPRPLLEEYLPCYSASERQRFLVRPGLTGLAQVSGRNLLRWDDRLATDVQFVQTLSPALYWKILFKTPLQVFAAEGVAVDAYTVSRPLHVERGEPHV